LVKSLLLLVLSALILVTPLKTKAQSDVGYSGHPAAYVAAGLFVVDAGVSFANGLAVSMGTASKANGYFGIGVGVASLGFTAVTYAMEDDKYLRDNFAIFMGSAGTVALVTGILAVRQVGQIYEAPTELSRLHVSPAVMSDGNRGKAYGLQIKFDF
jgi:hypothetical protein